MKRLALVTTIYLLASVFLIFSSDIEAKSYASEFQKQMKTFSKTLKVESDIAGLNCSLNFTTYPGLRVSGIGPRAQSQGLKRNDIILSVDGQKLSPIDELGKVILGKGKSPDDFLEVVVDRSGMEISLKLVCKDGTDYIKAWKDAADAVLHGKWDDCIKYTYELRNIAGIEYFDVAQFRTRCAIAKRKRNTPNYDEASYTYATHKLHIQEATGSDRYLDEIRPEIFRGIDWLNSNNFARLANQLEKDLKKAEIETGQTQPVQRQTPSQSDTPVIGSSGTCFFVDGFGTAVTNNHVIDGYSKIEVIASSGSKSSATIIKTSGVLDVAVLATGHQTPRFLTLAANGTLALGQDVFTIGFPVTNLLGDKPKYSEGTISALSGLNNDDSWIQMSTPIQPGNSGGPLVDLTGHVVGIVTATAAVEKFFAVTGSLPQNINWAIKANYVRALVPETSTNTHLSNKQEVIAHTEKSVCRVIAR